MEVEKLEVVDTGIKWMGQRILFEVTTDEVKIYHFKHFAENLIPKVEPDIHYKIQAQAKVAECKEKRNE